MAYAVYGRNYKSKLGSNRPKGLAEALGVSVEHASEASRAVDAFCMSADRELAAHHIPSRGRNAGGSDDAMKLCSALWARMCDVTDRQVLMSHDGYLKLFQLSRPRLDQEFDIILVDEFQDTNPVAVALFMAQSCRKVFVGDDHQSIYAFRGATNAFASIKADETLLLTESYRFGPETARLATLLLAGYKSETEPLVGLNVAARTDEGIDDSKPYAILCRTNAGLFSRAVDQLDHKNSPHWRR